MRIVRRAFLPTFATAALALGASAPALSAVQINTIVPGTPDSYQIFGTNMTGNPVYGTSPQNNSPINVTFTANTTTDMTINGGFAQIDDAALKAKTTPLWTWIIINPDLLFTDMKFAISLNGGTGNVDLFYLLAGGPTSDADVLANYTQCLTCTTSNDGSDKNYEVNGTLGESFNGIALRIASGQPGITIGTMKQMSYEPAPGAVPEAATWAMMLLGFGGIGMSLRRRKTASRLLQLA